jgi:hypothetical protein
VSRGTGKRDVHLVNDGLKAPTVLLATGRSDRHLSPGSSLAESKGQPIQLCLSGLPTGNDAEVDNDASIFGERCGELIAIDRPGNGSFPVCPGDLNPHFWGRRSGRVRGAPHSAPVTAFCRPHPRFHMTGIPAPSRFSTRRDGQSQRMPRYRIGLLPVVWIVAGVVVAAIYDYFDSLSTVGRILTAIAAVLAWPLLLFGFDISIQRS